VVSDRGQSAPDPGRALAGRRVVIAKLGFDAHWRGVIVVANALRNAGMEVIYLGHATPAQVAATAIQEDADLIGLSSLSGNHLDEAAAVLRELQARDGLDIPVIIGGTIPAEDARTLTGAGLSAVFPTGSPLAQIRQQIAELLGARDRAVPR
jgi:methylmalonyl-CoA mutase C-terminal domain/subunit